MGAWSQRTVSVLWRVGGTREGGEAGLARGAGLRTSFLLMHKLGPQPEAAQALRAARCPEAGGEPATTDRLIPCWSHCAGGLRGLTYPHP